MGEHTVTKRPTDLRIDLGINVRDTETENTPSPLRDWVKQGTFHTLHVPEIISRLLDAALASFMMP